MTEPVSIIIPIAEYHQNVYKRALASVAAQDVPCVVWGEIDTEKRGAGAMRNKLLEQVTTPYVVFLDADDWLEPTFLAETIPTIRPGRYVYTGWYEGDEIKYPPQRPWCETEEWHIITALLYTEDVRRVGGFDETLPAVEDTDFWLKLTSAQVCGIPYPKPLVHYGREGQRAWSVRNDGTHDKLKEMVTGRYKFTMGCCGQPGETQTTPVGQRQPGDVLAKTLWGGNMRKVGRATGRTYERCGNGRQMWVDPRDVSACPEWWELVLVAETKGQPPKVTIIRPTPARMDTLEDAADVLAQRGFFGRDNGQVIVIGDEAEAPSITPVDVVVSKAKKQIRRR